MPKGKKALREIIKGDLLIQLNEVWRKGESYQDNQKGDNIQGTLHCKAVETNLCKLIPDDKKEKELSQTELFVLSAAACLHDIGKVVIDDAKGWKSDHGKRSMEIILKEYDKLGLDKGQAIAVGYVVSVHGDGRLDELPPKLAIGSEEISLIGLAAIFRLADMLDTNYQRVPEILRIIKFPEGDVPSKWKGRPAITGWYLDEKDRIILQAVPKKDEIDSVYTLKAMMNEDLAQISPYLKLYEYPFELGELDLGDVFIKAELKKKAVIKRPFPGMAFYTKDDAKIFKGRDKEIEDLLSIVSNWPITLLIGESGAGKTSLIHAGLFPKLDAMSWRYVCTRPFDNPEENIKKMLWSAFFEGNIDPTMNLLDVMKNAAEKIKPKKLLVVMDQFEDILNCGVKEILDDFCLRLTAVQTGTIIPNLRILISFREDALVKINSRLLKKITGSAYQLPSVELERLTREGATKALLAGLENAHIGLDPRQEKGQKSLIEIILDDIQKGDDRLYPPFIQMVSETLCGKVNTANPIITMGIYMDQLKGANNIIARYLMERLKEFGSQKDKAERVLVFLTSSTGKKAQKNLKELSRATEIEMDELKEIVNKMVDLRMALAASEDEFEIIHDYLGKIVDEELVKEEDRTIKFLEEQLNSFYQNYKVHGTPIMDPILMVNLYRNRRKIKITEEKYPLILCTCLYKKVGLGWYWLKDLNTSKIVEMKKGHPSHGFIDIKEDETISELQLWDKKDEIGAVRVGPRDLSPGLWAMVYEEYEKRIHPGGIDKILELLKTEDGIFRDFALEEFKEIAKSGNVDKIIELLQSEDCEVWEIAWKAFVKVAEHWDMDKILEMLHHQVRGVRRAGVKALKKIAKPEDAEYLLDLLAEESQCWSEKQQDFLDAIRELDRKFYCPYYEEEEE